MCKLLMNVYFEQEYERNIQKQQKIKKEQQKQDTFQPKETKAEKQNLLQKVLNYFR